MSESIRKVSTIFTIDDNEHNRKLKEINSQYKLTQSEIKLAGDRMNSFGKNTDDLKYKQEALVKQTETLKDKINLYKDSIEKASNRAEENNKKLQELKTTKQNLQKEYKEAVKLYGEESEEAKKLKDQLDKVNAEYTEQKAVVDKNINSVNNHKVKLNETEAQLSKVQGELKKTSTELDKQNSKWLSAGESLKKAGDNISKFGEKASKVGGTLTKAVTLPVLAIGTAAVKTQIDFESAFAGVKKTVDGTTEQLAALEKGIKDMSKELPSSAEDIAAVAESAGQLGIQTDNILSFTRTIIDLGNATNLVGEEGASQLAKFANITQMSQKDFDKLGSTIVALGNNMATTEADIVSMAMRLAGAGKQVGMTESDIMSFSAALSSVGIEAEAGGSAFSKVMLEMQMSIQSGSESVGDFAKVAGMSTKEFADKFKNDATGALITFIEGLGKLDNKAVVLEDLGFAEIRVRDALLRASSAGDLFNKSIQIGSQAWKENTALTNEASQRYATTESQIKILKNEIVDMAREIGVQLLPIVKDGLVVIKDLIDKFNNLSPATKENIIKFAALSATLGPVIGTTGKLAEGFGGVLKVAGKLSTGLGTAKVATAGVGTAAATAGGTAGVAGLATSLGGVVLAAAPYVLAGVAIAGAGYAIYKGLNEEVIPEVDLFADKIEYAAETMNTYGTYAASGAQATVTKISEATKTAVGAYVELDDSAKNEMQSLYVNSTVISEQIKNDMTSKFNAMSTQIIAGYEKQKTDSIAQLQEMFNTQSTLTAEEQANIMANTGTYYESKKTQTQDYENQINQIISAASQEKRALTVDETQQITSLQNQMRDNAVNALSENEIEAQVILQRMKDYDGRVTAEQASQHISKLNESRDNAVSIANDEYEKKIATITRLRDESKTISSDQANKMIEDAKRQRDGIVEKAEDTRKQAVDKIFSMNKDLQKNVDSSTGEIIGFWQRMFGTWDKWKPETKYAKTVQYTERMSGNVVGNALGTSYFQGGLTEINERGYEVVELPRGSKVKNHLQSENMIKDTAIQTANAVIEGLGSLLSSDKQVVLTLNDRILGEAMIPIVSTGLAQNTRSRR